ncbi:MULTISPECIES: VOC family protein [unclassified Afipia]|jgi:PhnB protein|uniref:VOC family protein n=1 Tax=unclassified Afipia TaxID=2642050 RepID=UPI00040827F5|nr:MULTISPECIES: VOC family protein [unclassified Afipia]MBQ8104472.1 VOC family protein [Afipia sp.]MBS4006787.1 VOC family protein [Afipia sp.]WIG52615.1 MAG: Glyoxalase family protein [Afipia sp.]
MADQYPTLPPLIPHLVVNGASDAIEFYKKALGATEVTRLPAEDGKRLMHAQLLVNGAVVFLNDHFSEYCEANPESSIRPPNVLGGTSFVIHLEVPNCDEAVKRAADAGAKVIMAPWDAFWGARYGQVVDPFGHGWSFAHPLPVKAA